VFECSETFISNVLKFSKRNVLEEDYNKWYILTMPQRQSLLAWL
jgi:hypothetical protein